MWAELFWAMSLTYLFASRVWSLHDFVLSSFILLRLQFKRILGRGSFKTVYAAFDTVDALEVAWNKLHVDRLDDAEKKKIINEVRLLGQINHKNIIRLYDSFTCKNENSDSEGSIAFITEQMMSGTLKQYLKMAQNVKLKVIRKWCSNILEAVAYLHQRRIMHRDLKLDNLFMNGHVGEVKIGDLGLSAVRDTNQKAESVIGTPEFMAPELYEEAYTEKVDIYAFGMCLLEMVTMEYPYTECKGPAQIMKKVFSNERPESFHRLADSDVKDVIAQCLERESDRPSAAELLQHPLFRDWESDDGKRSNLSLMRQGAMSLEIPNGPQEVIISGAIANAPTIAFSEQLNRDVLVETREATESTAGDDDPGISVTPAVMGGVAGGAVGGLRLELQWPFEDALKSVSFSFNPGDRPDELAGEMVSEFGLAPSQHALLTEAIDAKVKEMLIEREREQENFARSPKLYGIPTASTEEHVGRQTLNGLGGGDEQNMASSAVEGLGGTPGVGTSVGGDMHLELVARDLDQSHRVVGGAMGEGKSMPPRSASVPPQPATFPLPPPQDEVEEQLSDHQASLGQSRSSSLPLDEAPAVNVVGAVPEKSALLSQVQGQRFDADSGQVGQVQEVPASIGGVPQRVEIEPAEEHSINTVPHGSFLEHRDAMAASLAQAAPPPPPVELVLDGNEVLAPSPKPPPVLRAGSTARSIVVVGGDKKNGTGREVARPSIPSDAPARTLTTSNSGGNVRSDSHERLAGALLGETASVMLAPPSTSAAVTPVSMLANASLPPPVPVLPATAGDPNNGLSHQQPVAQHSMPHHASPQQPKPHQQAYSQDLSQHVSQPQQQQQPQQPQQPQQQQQPQQLTSQQQNVHPSLAALQPGPAAGVHISASSPSNLSIRTTSFRSAQSDDSGGLSSSLLSPVQTAPVPATPVPANGMPDSDYDQKWYTMCLELMHNASRGRFALVKQKLAQGASVTFADYDKRTPLHLAAAAGSLATVNVLIENGANVNVRDRWGGTPLRDAVSENRNEVIVRLREAGALDDEDGGDEGIDKPSIELIQFSSHGNLDAVKERVSSGVSVSVADYEERTPLHLACSHGHADVVDFLLLNGASPYAKDKAGRTPTDNAARNGHRNVLEVLRRQDLDAPLRALLMNDNRSPTVATVGPSSGSSAPPQQTRSPSGGVWTADKGLPMNGDEIAKMNGAGRPKSSPNQFNQEQLALLQTQAAISHSISMGHIGVGSDGFVDARDVSGGGVQAPNAVQYPGSDNRGSGIDLTSGLSSQSLPVSTTTFDAGAPREQDVTDAGDANVREEIERERFLYEQERSRLDAEYRAKIDGLNRKTTSTSNRTSVDYGGISPPGVVQVSSGMMPTSGSSDQLPPRGEADPVQDLREPNVAALDSGLPLPPSLEFSSMALEPHSTSEQRSTSEPHSRTSEPSSPDPSGNVSQQATGHPSLPTIHVQVPLYCEQTGSIPESIVSEIVQDSLGDGAGQGTSTN